jgi:XXXCH domain-containing protein
MKEKFEETLSREGLADYLESLAQDLRQGELEASGNTWSVPEEMEAKVSLKEKKGRLSLKLKVKWETLPEYEPEAREPVVQWQQSFKGVKERLQVYFKDLHATVLQGNFPDPQTMENFIEASLALADLADPEWEEAMQAYLDHLEALKRAVACQDLEATRHEVLDLRIAMVVCHREFG